MAINVQMQGEAREASPNPVERAIEQFQRVRSGSVERSRSVEAILDQKVDQLFQRLSGQIQGLAIENGLLKANVEVLKSSLAQSELGYRESLSTQEKAHQETLNSVKEEFGESNKALAKKVELLTEELTRLRSQCASLNHEFVEHWHDSNGGAKPQMFWYNPNGNGFANAKIHVHSK